MQKNSVKQALAEGKVQLGTGFGQLRSPEVGRILAAAGFHWAFIDCEHGGFDLETVQDICRVARLAGLCPIVRVGDMQYTLVARALDCGAMGIILPRIESPEVLEKAVSWAKFPPQGVRGYGLTPVQTDYEPLNFNQIIEHVNSNTMVVFQIETKRGIEAREELLAVAGVDAVMMGPADLSISLGVPGEFQHPKMVDAMESVRESCDRHKVAPGTQTRTPDLARFWKERGIRFLGCSNETGMILERGKELVSMISAQAASR
jgi:2-dehydro-3-deoxyglucarate aldolase/4-hydroxy-2-oxoheptanedioate aldolase